MNTRSAGFLLGPLAQAKSRPTSVGFCQQATTSGAYLPLSHYSLWMNTMTRCTSPLSSPSNALFKIAACALLTGAGVLFSTQISAQQLRDFPPTALRGKLVVQAPPQVTLDGKPDQLSPGARIRNPQNMFVMSATLTGQTLAVNYTRESNGMIHEVWVLTPEEAAIKRASAPGSGWFSFLQ